jgi:hypothetical protein
LEDPLATMRAREVKAMVGDGVVGMNEE